MRSIAIHPMGVSVAFPVDDDSNFANEPLPEKNEWIDNFLRNISRERTRLFCEDAEYSPDDQELLESVTKYLRQKILHFCQYSQQTLPRGILHRSGTQVSVLRQNVLRWDEASTIIEDTLESCYQLLRSHGIDVDKEASAEPDEAQAHVLIAPIAPDAIMAKRA